MSKNIGIGTLILILAVAATVIYIELADESGTFWKEIPDSYVPACDAYFGNGNWETVGMDWIDFDPKFVRDHGDLFYFLTDENGENEHEYGCMRI